MPALRAMWAALVDVYDATLALVIANVFWLLLNLPLYAILYVFISVFLGLLSPDDDRSSWALFAAAWFLPFVPSPAAVALGGMARDTTGPDVPHLSAFWGAFRAHWRIALAFTAISLVTGAALLGNAFFYATVASGWLRLASILWLYGTLFWLGVHVYLVPLMLHVEQPRVFDLYRRAAFIVLGHPGLTIVLLLLMSLVALISVVFLPIFVILGGAYLAQVQARALREVRRRHGDLLEEERA